jgi:glycosyltransferase involved in cell wall biosynthesis
MFKQKKPLKILLTGSYAPPYGGASVYVKRLFDYLVREGHFCHVFDMFNDIRSPGPPGVFRVGTKRHMYFKIMCSPKYDIIHINESMWKHRAMLIILARMKGSQSVLMLHSFRDTVKTLGWLDLIMLKYVLKHVDYIISPGKNEMEAVYQWYPDRKDMEMITPFIPPEMLEADFKLPEALEAFFTKHQTIICANGSNLNFYKGADIYGLDLMVELCHLLESKHDVAVVYCLTGANDPEYLKNIHSRIDTYGLTERFYIYTEEVAFWKVIAKSKVFIRPTRTDSFGISVAEGILLGTPTVASDVCERPQGTILFKTGDLEDLYQKTVEALNSVPIPAKWASSVRKRNGAPMIENLYYKLTRSGNALKQ